MQNVNKNILLISYVFPPYYGIGGRRWAKHALALTKLGYTLHVITAANPFKKESLWFNQIKNNKHIILYSLKPCYPKVLLKNKLSFLEKIAYKFWLILLPFITNRNIYDRSLFWNKPMMAKASELIQKHKIEKLICSGGPFSVMYYASTLKKKFKTIFILNDLRDPWTWAPNWGFPSLSVSRLEQEQKLEKAMIEESDVVSVPTNSMLAFLKNKYPALQEKFIIIPHVFDESEITVKEKTPSEKLRLLYYGTIYDGIETSFDEVLSAVHQNLNISLHIYSDSIYKIENSLIKYNSKHIVTHTAVSPSELFANFHDFDYILMINPSYNKDNISTKFYEIIYSRTPIILVSPPGEGPLFISKNNLGIHLTQGQIKNTLNALVLKTHPFRYNNEFNIHEFSLSNVAKKISIILESRNHQL